MDKQSLHQALLMRLRADLELLERAAHTAREAATHEESKAENKYDTRGLEASYLGRRAGSRKSARR